MKNIEKQVKVVITGNDVIINIMSSENKEVKKDLIHNLINPTDMDRAWENHENNMYVGIKNHNTENGEVSYTIFIDETVVDLGLDENIRYLKFKLSSDLATALLQDFYMEGLENKDLKISELNNLTIEGEKAHLEEIRIAIQMTIFEELSKFMEES